MRVPLLDLKSQYKTIKEEILKVTEEIYESQYFIMGPHVAALEEKIAEYCGCGFAVGVSSGTDALIISLMAADIGPGDLVLTSPYTFFATGGSIARVGAEPRFCDIDPDTYNLSPQCVRGVIAAMDEDEKARLKAIIPVHLYGQCADMAALSEIAAEHGLVVIEDAAQAIGSEYRGKRAGSMGDFGCFSFFPSKNLGAFGDGGIVTTNSEEMYDKLVKLRNHGSHPKYYHQMVGGNFRLDALQAAVVSIKLVHLDDWTRGRQENAATYRALFEKAGLTELVKLPEEREDRHIYNQFVISVENDRDGLKEALQKAEIGHEVYYPVPLHLQECFTGLGYGEGSLPVSEYSAKHTLALPVYPELTDEQLAYVVDTVKDYFSAGA